MRIPSFAAFGALLLIAPLASAVTMDWTPVGNPGNACDTQPAEGSLPGGCFGAVNYSYSIGMYEVTNAEYAEFLNAIAASDPLQLYDTEMGTPTPAFNDGGITRSGSPGNYTYSPISGRQDLPVNFVTIYDAMRFANWMNNGQGNGDTETGAYTLIGGTPTPSNGTTLTRNAGATIVLPTQDEWYKAAYYDSESSSYFDYPAGTDTQTVCSAPTATANRANCGNAAGRFPTPKGSYPGSGSPYGTFDQGGNVHEWDETIEIFSGDVTRVVRGGSFGSNPFELAGSHRLIVGGAASTDILGFRLAMIPEPGTGLLVIAGVLGLAGRQRLRAGASIEGKRLTYYQASSQATA